MQASADNVERMDANRDFIVARQLETREFRTSRIPVALGIVGGWSGRRPSGPSQSSSRRLRAPWRRS